MNLEIKGSYKNLKLIQRFRVRIHEVIQLDEKLSWYSVQTISETFSLV